MAIVHHSFTDSIRFRFIRIIAVVLTISALVLSAIIGIREMNMLERSLMTKGRSLASFIAKMSEDPLVMQDTIQLDAIVHEANLDEDVIYTVIYDLQGNLMTSAFASVDFRAPRLKQILEKLPKGSELPEIITAINSHEPLMEFSVPVEIYAKKIGTIVIGMSRYGIRQQVFMTILSVLAVNAAVAVILGFVLFIFFRRILLRPITSLATAVDRLAQGELNTRVEIDAAGEVKMLVDSFNAMANDLQKTTVSRDYVDGIIRSMADTLLVIDPDGTIKTMNAALTGLLGYEEELQGKPLDVLLANGKTEAENLIRLMQQEGWISSIETVYLSRVGKRIPVLISGASLQDKGGTTSGFVLIGKDISDRKKAEEKLQSYSLDLLNVNEEIKSFANIVSHDLRAPLVNIKGFSEELQQSLNEIGPCFQKHFPLLDQADREKVGPILKKDIPEALSFISSSVNRMDSLINSILKLSRAGRRELSPERLSVQGLVGNIVNSLAHQIETRGIRVIAEGLPDVVADKVAMEQIFGNLIDNAIKYLEPGRPGEIVITAAQNETDMIFHVRDNGRGMAREDIPRAFELFRRVGKQDVPGEGMGLAYVRTLVRLLGGRIWCESRPGEGTTFSFTLPMAGERSGVLSAPG